MVLQPQILGHLSEVNAKMKCYTYVVKRDVGFAPNPFGGYCTLATCKPNIRSIAKVRDWVIGTGSAKQKLTGRLIFAMQVTETMNFNDYWNDSRFQFKKPALNGSLRQAYGDNIYHYSPITQEWHQANSHHSNEDGSINYNNLNRDTKKDRVLISSNFYYFGKECPILPNEFAEKICHGRGHKNIKIQQDVEMLVNWITNNFEANILYSFPLQFNNFKRYDGKS